MVDWLIPDRDNTFLAFEYRQDGVIDVRPGVHKKLANRTIQILNLNRKVRKTKDQKGNLLALDKRTQRMDSWGLALRYKNKWDNLPKQSNVNFATDAIVDLATKDGFFSIWMAAFDGVPEIRKRLIQAFPGTETACFDPVTTQAISSHPNTDGLSNGGKL